MEPPGWQVCSTSWRLNSAVKERRLSMDASACASFADLRDRLKTVFHGRLPLWFEA